MHEQLVIRIFSSILFFIISNNAFAIVKGKTLICDQDSRGYNFISKDKVEISVIDFVELNIISINHSYELTESAIFIKQPLKESSKEKKTKLIGWIFRRTLDYVSLNYKNGDLSRNFLWSCEVTSSTELKIRLKNNLDKLLKYKEK